LPKSNKRVKGESISRICSNCSAENIDSAKFCVNCGHSLIEKEKIGHLSRKSYFVITVALIIAVFIVFLIQYDNNRVLKEKLTTAHLDKKTAQEQMSAETERLHDKIISLEAEVEKDSTEVEKLTELANSYFDIGNFKKAIAYYAKVLRNTPNNANILIDIGVSYFNISMGDTAILLLKRAVQINPKHQQGLYNLGIIYYNLGKTDEALTTWKRLIELNGNSKETQNAKKFIEQISKQSKSS
jgi:tetratricopeptide (TPR) repeat protein